MERMRAGEGEALVEFVIGDIGEECPGFVDATGGEAAGAGDVHHGRSPTRWT